MACCLDGFMLSINWRCCSFKLSITLAMHPQQPCISSQCTLLLSICRQEDPAVSFKATLNFMPHILTCPCPLLCLCIPTFTFHIRHQCLLPIHACHGCPKRGVDNLMSSPQNQACLPQLKWFHNHANLCKKNVSD